MGIASRTWDKSVAFAKFESMQGDPIAVYHNYAQNDQTYPSRRLTHAASIRGRTSSALNSRLAEAHNSYDSGRKPNEDSQSGRSPLGCVRRSTSISWRRAFKFLNQRDSVWTLRFSCLCCWQRPSGHRGTFPHSRGGTFYLLNSIEP